MNTNKNILVVGGAV